MIINNGDRCLKEKALAGQDMNSIHISYTHSCSQFQTYVKYTIYKLKNNNRYNIIKYI